jgi:hypothetical protein
MGKFIKHIFNLLESNRSNFRPRQLDLSKPIQLIHDLSEICKKSDYTANNWITNDSNYQSKYFKEQYELEINRIVDLFDKKKTIVIPKSENVQAVHNHIIKNNYTIETSYKQSEYVRPKHLIVYSCKNSLETKRDEYEATTHDRNFLKYEKNLTLEEIEKVISELENDVNKGEMIPYERIKEIIFKILPDKKSQGDKIAKVNIKTLNFYMY